MKNKILVIEDEPAVLENIIELLESEGYEAQGAENGRLGVDTAVKFLPDLIICDIMMPYADGYSVLNSIKEIESVANTPFIFLTARADKNDIRKGMDLGADDYLIKPFTPDDLFRSVNTRLHKKEKIQIESKNKLKELSLNLASSIPHEFRTPLNGILASIQLLMDYDYRLSDTERKEMYVSVFDSAKRLEKLIYKYLSFVECELILSNADKLTKCAQNVMAFPAGTAQEIMEIIASKHERSQDLVLNLADETINIGEEHFRKICEEISDNAFKFSEKGSKVEVVSFFEPYRNIYSLEITDYGIGLTNEQIAGIGAMIQFDRKYMEQQGSGLGLAIVKMITEIYNIPFKIESVKNEKTKISLFFKALKSE